MKCGANVYLTVYVQPLLDKPFTHTHMVHMSYLRYLLLKKTNMEADQFSTMHKHT
jgi:hypothetical protein